VKKRIALFAPIFTSKLTGIGRYSYEISKRLPVLFPDIEFFIITNKIGFKRNINIEIIQPKGTLFSKLPSLIWFRYFSFLLLKKIKPDIIFSFQTITPKYINIAKFITVHDLNLYLVAETMKFKTYLSHRLFFESSIKEADKIISVSKSTSDKLNKFLGRSADIIVRPGIDTNIFTKRECKEKYLKYKFILSVATLEPRKNIENLILAFISLKKESKLKNIKLVLVGDNGWKNKKVRKLINNNISDIVHFGYISDNKLIRLYNCADVFVFPSIYEGFGIPVLEARNCGCCVITTDIPELREACGPGCIYIKPDVFSIKLALEKYFSGKLKCYYDNKHVIRWDDEIKKLRKIFI